VCNAENLLRRNAQSSVSCRLCCKSNLEAVCVNARRNRFLAGFDCDLGIPKEAAVKDFINRTIYQTAERLLQQDLPGPAHRLP
jgi:hypothetical protein